MLRTLRKNQKVLMVIIFAVVVIAFGFLHNAADSNMGSGAQDANVSVRIDNHPVFNEEFNKILRQTQLFLLLTSAPTNLEEMELMRSAQLFVSTLQVSGPLSPKQADETGIKYNQVANLLTLREYAKNQGIAVTEEAVSSAITKLPLLADPNTKQFSSQRLELLLNTGLPYGPNQVLSFSSVGSNPEALLREIVRDWLTFQALTEKLAIVTPANSELTKIYSRLNAAQTEIASYTTTLDQFELATESEVDEDAFSAWYEENKQAFYSAESRRILLAIGSAERTSVDETTEIESTVDSLLPSTTISDESWNDLRARYDAFYLAVLNGTEFTKAATEANLQLVELDGVSFVDAPELLKNNFDAIRLAFSTRKDAKISEALEQRNKGQILTLRVLEITPPQPQKLEEVREAALLAWRKHQAQEAATTAISALKKQVETHFKEHGNLENFELEDQRFTWQKSRYIGGAGNSQNPLDKLVRNLPLGSLTETQTDSSTNTEFTFALVTARRIDTESLERIDSQLDTTSVQINLQNRMLIHWFTEGRRALQVSLPPYGVQ